ncbi:MAG TPA: chemotaxis protein CheA [Gammaproteobacteria bacterium]
MRGVMDDELLNDFLAEASELIESLDSDLLGLESSPNDRDVLNGVFRAFHTIKGGAGFLGLKALVDVCHRAEDLLNLARSDARPLGADDIDLVLRSVDEVKRMFGELADGKEPEPAPDALLAALERAMDTPRGATDTPAGATDTPNGTQDARSGAAEIERDTETGAASPAAVVDDDPVLASFEAMLAEAGGGHAPEAPAAPPEPVEDELDALIDAIRAGDMDTVRALAPDAALLRGAEASEMPHSAPPAASADPAGGRHADLAADATENAAPRALHGVQSAPKPAAAAGRAAPRPAEASLRIEAGRIDDVMNLVGELVLVRNRLTSLRNRVRDEDLNRTLSSLDLVTSDLQSSVMRLRMQPVSKVFGRFPRVVRDLARQLGKEVELETVGEGTELDKGMVESLADPLVHLVRNAVDHGIEPPDERERAGKPRSGRLVLSARQEGNHIFVGVRDDGAGLDPAVIRQKAVERGLIDAHAALQLSDDDALQLLFSPGFSTRSEVTDVSGRGVGLDVVKSVIGRVNGTVEIRSEKGAGTEFQIRLPLTLAILPALMVVVSNQVLALPLPVVEEIADYDARDASVLDGREVLSLRGEVLPLLDLERWVGPPAGGGRRVKYAVVATTGVSRAVLLVDKLLGQEDVVIKSLGSRLRTLPGFAGATITGDGRIALIIDVGTLLAAWSRVAIHAPQRSAA